MPDWTPFPAFEGIQGSTDKNGIEAIDFAWYMPTLAMARDFVPAGIAAEIGLPLLPTRTLNQEWGNDRLVAMGKDGAYKVVLKFAGMRNPVAGIMNAEFETDGYVSDEPAEAHPDLNFLKQKYGGRVEDGKLVWDEEIPSGGLGPTGGHSGDIASGMGLVGGGLDNNLSPSQVGIPNPLFNFKKWKMAGLTWTRTYATIAPPPELTRRLGKVDFPPSDRNGYRPTIPDHREWFKLVGKASPIGNVYRVTESWLACTVVRDVYR